MSGFEDRLVHLQERTAAAAAEQRECVGLRSSLCVLVDRRIGRRRLGWNCTALHCCRAVRAGSTVRAALRSALRLRSTRAVRLTSSTRASHTPQASLDASAALHSVASDSTAAAEQASSSSNGERIAGRGRCRGQGGERRRTGHTRDAREGAQHSGTQRRLTRPRENREIGPRARSRRYNTVQSQLAAEDRIHHPALRNTAAVHHAAASIEWRLPNRRDRTVLRGERRAERCAVSRLDLQTRATTVRRRRRSARARAASVCSTQLCCWLCAAARTVPSAPGLQTRIP